MAVITSCNGKPLPVVTRHTRSIFFILCFFLLQFSAVSQAVKFTHLTNLDGLSQSTVLAIVKDKYGFLWFGTQDGLNRFDGYSFKVYRHKPNDPTSLRRSHINRLYEDRKGNLWVGTSNGGLSLYDREKDHFIHIKEAQDTVIGLSQKTVTALYEDKQNNFWIGTFWKLNLLDRKTGKITHFGYDANNNSTISNDGITCIYEDKRNNLWVGTANGLNLLDRKTKKFKRIFHSEDGNSISDNYITAIKEDKKGRLWVGTNKGLNLYDHRSGSFKRYLNAADNPTSIGNEQVTAIENADNGNIWIGTTSYLEYFNVEKGVFQHYANKPHLPTSLNKNGNVTALYKDREDILWIGTYQGGVNKYDKHLTYFNTISNNPNDYESVSFNIITGFAESRNGDIYIATGGGGLNLWKRATDKFIRFNPEPGNANSLSNYGTLCLYQSKKTDHLWIGTYGSGVDCYDPKTNVFRHITVGALPEQLNNNAVYAILEDNRSNVWMGTNGGGVNVLDQKTGIIKKFMNDPNDSKTIGGNYIRNIYEDRKGQIWIGSTAGISVFNPATNVFTNYNQSNTQIESDIVFAITEDKLGNMWIGTLGGGLVRIDHQTNKIKSYTTENGLPDNTINSIQEDSKGHIWVSTNNGISSFDPARETFKNWGLENGIQSFEFSHGAGFKTSSGEILFGGINGFNTIEPAGIVENKNVPPVVITGMMLFNKPVKPFQNNKILTKDILETKEITLDHRQSIITFEFAALGFTGTEKNQYAYKLEGFDKEWNFTGNSRRATYTNLPPGKYTFRVIASNNDGAWNKEGASLSIVITPPVWQTWWFRVLAIGFTVASILFLYNMRMRSEKQQKILLEKQVQERTEKLVQMTESERKARKEADDANFELERKNKELEQFAYVASHDLQEPLRTTTSFVELLQLQYRDKLDERAEKYMTFIGQASERMKVLVNDLLEYSRIGKKKELAHVDCNEVMQTVIADLGSAIRETNAEIQTQQLPFVWGYQTEIKLLLQNLIVNALKFRKKDTAPVIDVSCVQEEETFQFSVRDNGIGIEEKHNERIFIIFQRLHTRNEFQGSGIGLSHCKKIVELHKGRIWVDSTVGNGSTFHFTLNKHLSIDQQQ